MSKNCILTTEKYIKNTFSPQVAVLCSEDADKACLKNNLQFIDLIQPFTKLYPEVQICDTGGNSIKVKNLRVVFEDMNRRPPQPVYGKKMLHEAVLNAPWDEVVKLKMKNGLELTQQRTASWFEAWRELFLQIQYPSDHEFTKHFLACIIIISAGSENPMLQLSRLSQYQHQQQHQNPGAFPKWFCPNILKYYVLVHDVSEIEASKAEEIFQQMTTLYGIQNCHLLHINSRPADQRDSPLETPDPWKKYLRQKSLIDKALSIECPEVSNATDAIREDISEFPSRVTEGENSEMSDIVLQHPLSPATLLPDESIKAPPDDVPLLNKQFLTEIDLESQNHGIFLTLSDSDRIQMFIDEFILRALIPYVERQIKFLNDIVTSRSKSKSILSATRRWLGSSKQPSGNSNSVIYSQEASELQTRRLGDLCFMFGLYEMAYNAYYTAKNDFKNDQAWLYFAGAQEMTALTSFMINPSDYPKRYLEGSLHTYLNVCKVYNFAIRITLLSTEMMKHSDDYGEAAMMFIKMTSEESDLLSALMLEQAAQCFLHSKKPLCRKYAFHMTLSGHRFSKAGQRAHSYRAYKQAIEVYFGREWKLAEDHIHYSMGKQAFHLKETLKSKDATVQLIRASYDDSGCNQISKIQQTTYLRELLNITEKLILEEKLSDLPNFPVPIIDSQKTNIILSGVENIINNEGWQPASHVSFSDNEALEKEWLSLEEDMARHLKAASMIFRPELQKLTASTPNSNLSSIPVKEKIYVEVYLNNPLLINLNICNIRPLLHFFNEKDVIMPNIGNILLDEVSEISIEPQSTKVITLGICPQILGRCEIYGISFKIAFTSNFDNQLTETISKISVEGKQEFHLIGPRLNNTITEKSSIIYAKDYRLTIKIISPMPKLSVCFRNIPKSMLCGQMTEVDVQIKNIGPEPLNSVSVWSSNTNSFWFQNESERKLGNDQKIIDRQMNSGEFLELPLFIHAPSESENLHVKLLFIYKSSNSQQKQYRIIRHMISIQLYSSLTIDLKCLRLFRVMEHIKNHLSSYSTNLVLKLKNSISSEKIKILAITAHSPSWKLMPYLNEDIDDIETSESCQLNMRCINIQNSEIIIFSSIPIATDSILPSGLQDFAVSENLLVLNTNILQVSGNRKRESQKPLQLPTSHINMALSLLWTTKADSGIIYGMHNLFLKEIGSVVEIPASVSSNVSKEQKVPVRIIPIDLETDTSEEQNSTQLHHLVNVTLDYPTCLSHNFQQMPICRIVYLVRLFNACDRGVDVLLELGTTRSVIPSQVASPQPSTNLIAIGGTTRRRSLSPGESATIKGESLASAPGTYCMGAFVLKAKLSSSNDWIEQSFPLQTGVVIRNLSSNALDFEQQW